MLVRRLVLDNFRNIIDALLQNRSMWILAAAFAAATAVLFQSRKGGLLLLLFALIMGFSRVYLEVHYCTDVLFGALFS